MLDEALMDLFPDSKRGLYCSNNLQEINETQNLKMANNYSPWSE
jgi:hypothetical protein